MPRLTYLTARLAARSSIAQIEVLSQLDAGTAAIDRAISSVWAAITRAMRGPNVADRARAAIETFPSLLAGVVRRKLAAMAALGHRHASAALLRSLPRPYLTRLAQRRAVVAEPALTEALTSVYQETAEKPQSFHGERLPSRLLEDPWQSIRDRIPTFEVPATIGDSRITFRVGAAVPPRIPAGEPKLSKEDFAAYLFPAPPKEKVERMLDRFVRPRPPYGDWQPLGDEPRRMSWDMAQQIATSVGQGKTPGQIAKDIRPHLDNSAMRAKRAARTFGALVATETALETHRKLGDMLQGWQIHATLDERTRPHHRTRAGTIYYLEPKVGQLGVDVMPRPPLEGDGTIAWN